MSGDIFQAEWVVLAIVKIRINVPLTSRGPCRVHNDVQKCQGVWGQKILKIQKCPWTLLFLSERRVLLRQLSDMLEHYFCEAQRLENTDVIFSQFPMWNRDIFQLVMCGELRYLVLVVLLCGTTTKRACTNRFCFLANQKHTHAYRTTPLIRFSAP